ncbi:type VII secretion system-associated protein [Streptomyces sp. NPDC002809]|uniref:type VII secretion system-associated protein n=1 Tax=Streptomyces sp. NPDC002809 TaxID=3154433 RepID=UPI0033180D1C
MATSFDLSHLDPENLQKFIDGKGGDGTTEGVQGVIDALVELQTDLDGGSADGPVMSMKTLSDALGTPSAPFGAGGLQIGLLAQQSGALAGGVLLTFVKGAATSLHPVESSQEQLFRDIRLNLGTTIAEMKKAQQDSLDQVDGATFLNDLHNVEDDLTTRPSV